MSSGSPSLAERYARRVADARELATGGAAVVGVVGADVPRALVEATGAVPLRLFGDEHAEVTRATEILGRSVDTGTVWILAGILGGEFDFLSGILVSHDCQSSILLFYALRELSRSGEIDLPVHLVDLVHLDRAPTRKFNVAQLRRATEVLGSWTGAPATSATLRTAIRETRALHAVLERIEGLRRDSGSSIAGVDSLHAFGVASALRATAAIDLLTKFTESAIMIDETKRLRLFFTGSSPLGDTLYRAIEARDAVIVGEDHDWGQLVLSVSPAEPEADTSMDLLLGSLTTALLQSAPAAHTSGQFARGRATKSAVARSGARAMLSIVRERDEAPAWDFPHQRDEAGVPAVMLDRQSADLTPMSLAQLAKAVEGLRGTQ